MLAEAKKWSSHELIALLALFGLALHLVLRFFFVDLSFYAPFPLYIVLACGGVPLVIGLLKNIWALEFGSDLLAGISIVTSIFLEEYLAGSLVVLMLSGGQSIEAYAVRTASKVLEALAKRAPSIAHRQKNGSIEDIHVDDIAVGDTVVIFPHEICPVDGDVIAGNGVMDESFLTGEPFLLAKAPGSQVLSGSINGDFSLTIKSTKLALDSRYSKIMEVMRATEQKRPKMRRIADQLGAWYTPIAVLIALIAWMFSGESIRFLSVLVIATPCPLLIAIPVSIIGSISLCASRGILIKDPIVLEQIGECKTMIFDKTGTLTYGIPSLTEEVVYGSFTQKEVLRFAASLERYSKHPLASAVLKKAEKEGLKLSDAARVSEISGKGLYGEVEGHQIVITGRKELKKDVNRLPAGAGLECVILIDGAVSACYRFHDDPRSESASFIKHLSVSHGFNKVMIVSGDREEEVRYLAAQVGITDVFGGQSPEQKVAIVEKERSLAKTAYLGDGINDAPALTAANVGVAFGSNSDITAEAAGAVILENSLEKVDEFLHISHRLRRIALQSALGGMGLSIIGMMIASLGFLPPVAGAISQEVIDVVVILNSLRTIWRPKILTDIF